MILDTSYLIDLMEGDEGAVIRKEKLLDLNETQRISAATIFELWSGISASNRSEEEKVKVLRAISGINVVNVTTSIAEKAGEIRGTLIKDDKSIEAADAMIAATAVLENETVLTRNIKHFGIVKGLRVESY